MSHLTTTLHDAWLAMYEGPGGSKTSASDLVLIAETVLGIEVQDPGDAAQALWDDECEGLELIVCADRFIKREVK